MKGTNDKSLRARMGVLSMALGLVVLLAATAAVSAQSTDALIGQIRTAITHGTLSYNSADIGPRLTHAQHVVNILEGENGANFDGSKGNPGDGHGAINYAAEAAESASGQAAEFAQNTRMFLQWADEEALRATKAASYEEAGEAIRRALAYLSAALGRPDDEGPVAAALALAAQPASITIDIKNFKFGDGQPLTIPVGTTVTWVNRDRASHTVTGGPLDSGTLNLDDSFSFTFTEAGTYDYICVFHPNMKGRIIVQ